MARVNILDEENLTDDERDNLLSYDPFSDGMQGDASDEVEDDSEVEQTPSATQDVDAEIEEDVEEVEDNTPAPQLTSREGLLTEQNELLRSQIRTIAESRAVQIPPKATAETQPEDNIPQYSFNITNDYLSALQSEDPNVVRQALQGIMSSTARAVHQNVQKEYQEYTGEAVRRYVERHSIASRIQTDVMTDYYGNYPNHNNPAVRQLVVAMGQQVLKERSVKEWNAEVRDEIARRVNSTLQSGLGVGASPPPVAAATGQKKQISAAAQKQPGGPKQMKPTSRPSAPSTSSVGEEVADLLLG